ncbi:hypothetical protein F751_1468 [Auxenochlorella protothecoides]|uniref:Uncharacterized protein n=1 Tax=Auxenochlorella protothecoides TaxID=3075 RepID=A0A087SJF0_AUXPR|nr:hypothetical protein F751_1468 [Auxenochlorella protothecoides]KFM25854.1 hypothetical protein F751_1468 [Auxenochlorella protothecoides]
MHCGALGSPGTGLQSPTLLHTQPHHEHGQHCKEVVQPGAPFLVVMAATMATCACSRWRPDIDRGMWARGTQAAVEPSFASTS